jgi:hypothetical protein
MMAKSLCLFVRQRNIRHAVRVENNCTGKGKKPIYKEIKKLQEACLVTDYEEAQLKFVCKFVNLF